MLEYAQRAAGYGAPQFPDDLRSLGRQMMQISMNATPAFQKAPAALRETLEGFAGAAGRLHWYVVGDVGGQPRRSPPVAIEFCR